MYSLNGKHLSILWQLCLDKGPFEFCLLWLTSHEGQLYSQWKICWNYDGLWIFEILVAWSCHICNVLLLLLEAILDLWFSQSEQDLCAVYIARQHMQDNFITCISIARNYTVNMKC